MLMSTTGRYTRRHRPAAAAAASGGTGSSGSGELVAEVQEDLHASIESVTADAFTMSTAEVGTSCLMAHAYAS